MGQQNNLKSQNSGVKSQSLLDGNRTYLGFLAVRLDHFAKAVERAVHRAVFRFLKRYLVDLWVCPCDHGVTYQLDVEASFFQHRFVLFRGTAHFGHGRNWRRGSHASVGYRFPERRRFSKWIIPKRNRTYFSSLKTAFQYPNGGAWLQSTPYRALISRRST